MWAKMSISSLLSPLLPQQCLLCGRSPVAAAICDECYDALPHAKGPRCPRCAAPLPHAAPLCARCLPHPSALDRAYPAFDYAFPIDRLLQTLKYGATPMFQRMAIADCLAASMAAVAPRSADLVVPIPLSPSRLRERGFNQALELAKPFARLLQIPLVATALIRLKETSPQTRLARQARLQNLREAFHCGAKLQGLRILLVDDVMTTGATLTAAAAALKAAGAAAVVGCVAARTR